MTLDSAGLATRATPAYDVFVRSQFTILNPCSKRWTELSGSGRVRFCETCQTPVHDFTKYSSKEWKQVWKENNGHVCAYHLPPPVHEQRSRRAVLLSALLSFAAPLFAQSGRVTIRVSDASGASVAGAEVALLGPDAKPIRTLTCNEAGEVEWTNLPVGNNTFRVSCRGFASSTVTVLVGPNAEIRRDVVLPVGTMGGAVFVDASGPPFKSSIPSELPEPQQSGRVRIRVWDQAGDQIPEAEVALLDGNDEPTRKQKVDNAGETIFTDLPAGYNRFRLTRPGFESSIISVTTRENSEVQRDTVLHVDLKNAIIDTVEPYIPPEQAKPTPHGKPKHKRWWIFW